MMILPYRLGGSLSGEGLGSGSDGELDGVAKGEILKYLGLGD
jgi:hypothetical protein